MNEPISETEYSHASEDSEAILEAEPQPAAEPAVREEKPHVSRHVARSEPGLNEIGIIYGNVGTTNFNIMLTGEIEKLEYVQTKHEHNGWILGQISEIERLTDLTLSKVPELSKGIDIEEKEVGHVSLIGYRDERNLLQSPRTPLKAGSKVYRANDDLIRQIIGLKENTDTGAYIGLLSGR